MIPKYEEIMLPMLKYISDTQEHGLGETHDALVEHFNLTDSEARELLPSGVQSIFRNRVGWAKSYMKKAGLIISARRGYFSISDIGIELLAEKPTKVNAKLLMRYEKFREFKAPKSKESHGSTTSHRSKTEDETDQTPEESFESAYQKLNSELANDVLDIVKSCSPNFFETLVIDLLIKMGYGGSRKDAGRAMGKSGDGGIDGIINEDKLGLDVIYLQAKKWENTVPVKEIRDFTGALASKKARKGIFITTSSFPSSVYEFVKQVEYKIVLIDGDRLASLMIEHNVGLSTTNTYHVKAIDSDYFEDN